MGTYENKLLTLNKQYPIDYIIKEKGVSNLLIKVRNLFKNLVLRVIIDVKSKKKQPKIFEMIEFIN